MKRGFPHIHICFFNRSFYPDQGSTGQLLTELATDLVRDYKCQVSIVAGNPTLLVEGMTFAPWKGWSLVRHEKYQGVEVLRARSTSWSKKSFVGRFANYLSYFVSSFLAGFCLRRPDIIVSLTDPPIIGLVAFFFSRLYRAKFIFLSQDIFPEVAIVLEDFRSEKVNRALERINRFLLQKADFVVAIGETMKARLVERRDVAPGKIVIIHNWVNCRAIYPGDKRNPFSLKHDLADKFVVMHAGNLGLSQALAQVIEAARLLRDISDLCFVFIGEGVKKAELQSQARKYDLTNVIFLPQHSKDQLRDPYASADVFIISLKEGLAGFIVPSKLYGILASGRPYVAVVEKDSEVATIAQQFHCGLLAEPNNPSDIAEKILMFYRNRDLAREMGKRGRIASAYFDQPVAVKNYYNLFQNVLMPPCSKESGRIVEYGPLSKRKTHKNGYIRGAKMCTRSNN